MSLLTWLDSRCNYESWTNWRAISSDHEIFTMQMNIAMMWEFLKILLIHAISLLFASIARIMLPWGWSDKRNFSSINWLRAWEMFTQKTEALCHALIHLQHEILIHIPLAVAVGKTAATSERETHKKLTLSHFFRVLRIVKRVRKKIITNRKTWHHITEYINICMNGKILLRQRKKYEKHAKPIFFNRCEISWSKKCF